MVIDTVEVVEDHVHIFLEAPPRLSPSRIVQILKSISAKELFRQFMQGDGELAGHTTDVSAEVTLQVEVIKGLAL